MCVYAVPMRSLHRCLLALSAAAVLAIPVGSAAQSPSLSPSSAGVYQPGSLSIQLVPFATGLSSPVFVTADDTGSGVLYAVEQGGTVRAIAPDGTVSTTPFLDIRDRVQSDGEQGLLGLAFHPDYATNGRLFVYYTRLSDYAQVVSEFHATAGVVDPGSERVVLEMADFAPNHNGGMLAFDQQGMLLIGTGDGGGADDPQLNGQDVTQLLAKLLRIDVNGARPYSVPANDPNGRLGPDARPEILATGLRNPWRYSVDRLTGDVFIGDVGQDKWEEVDVLPAGTTGANFGWSVVEGPECFRDPGCPKAEFVPPVVTYSHSSGDGCAIIGGYVYRGSVFPALTGAYLYGDECSGNLWLLSAAQAVAGGVPNAVTADLVGHLDGTLSAFGQGDDGELYAVDLGGRVLRVTATGR